MNNIRFQVREAAVTNSETGEHVIPSLDDLHMIPGFRLGKKPAKNHPKQLLFASFAQDMSPPPPMSDFWKSRAKFPARSYGNRRLGCCTRASQAVFATRMERIEQRRTIDVPEAEVVRVYEQMSDELYGGGDNGAYEIDALNMWRREDKTFRDSKGRPHLIDAYVRVNHLDMQEVRRAIHLAAGHGVKLCFAIPAAWMNRVLVGEWSVPDDGRLVGEWAPYSGGGHSMTADAYSQVGVRVLHTWFDGDKTVRYAQVVTWAGMSYCDEMYVAIDKKNAWMKRSDALKFDLTNLAAEVNRVSSVKVAA